MTELSLSIDGPIANLRLNRPEKANALDLALVEALHDGLDAATLAGSRLLILRGEGRNFCAGFDFTGFETMTVADLSWRFVRIEQFLQRLAHAPFATLALAHGGCFGAGADIVAACDTAIASENAKLRMPGWEFGLALGTRRLAARIGAASARQLLENTRVVTGRQALEMRLVDEICAVEHWDARVAEAGLSAIALESRAQARLRATLRADTRAADMAGLIESLTEGDLKARIATFRNSR